MKKFFKYFIFSLSIFFVFNINVFAKEKVKLYFFHGDGCPHCAEEEKFLKTIKKDKNVEIIEYEVWYNKKNANLMKNVANRLNTKSEGVPLTVIGTTTFSGYSEETGLKIKRAINYYKNHDCIDVVNKVKNNKYISDIEDKFSKYDSKTDSSSTVKIPVFGRINMKDVSIPTAAMLIGLVDGFNPCAMWVLLFLISMLLTMKNRKRMWVLGISFLVTSAILYLGIMMSWFTIVESAMASVLFRRIIALIAIVAAIINIRSFVKSSDSGCEVVDEKKRKKIFDRIRSFTSEKSFILALVGVVGLAISVNVIELACSAGLPLVFTQILALNNVTNFQAFIYTLIYILFFLIDDIFVFIIAMVTTKITGISTKYNKYSHLVGGIIMLLIGILLILKPEWLMFNFK